MPYKTLKCPKFDIPPTEGSILSVQASPHTTQNKLGLREMMQMLTVVLLLLLQ